MTWIKLTDLPDNEAIFRGSVFRYRKRIPKEEIVDYMLFEAMEGSGLGLIRDSGYDAGNILVVLPPEARIEAKVIAISPAWLSRHWQEWVDRYSTPDNVWVFKGGRLAAEKLPDE